MKVESKVIRSGGELLLTIPAHLAEKLDIQEGSTLFLEEKSYGLHASPFPDEVSVQMHIARQVMSENHNLLRRLAES